MEKDKLKFRPALIIWKDATSIDSWTELSEIHKEGCLLIYSIGFFLDQNEERVLLALNYSPSNESSSCIMSIPNGMIISLTPLEG